MQRIKNYLKRIVEITLDELTGNVIRYIVGSLLPAIGIAVCLLLNDNWRMLLVWLHAMEDASRCGYVHGRLVRSAQGDWVIDWRLGGPPLVHVIVPTIFWCVLLVSSGVGVLYFSYKYWRFLKFKRTCTIPRHHETFRKRVPKKWVLVIAILFFTGLVGITTDPRLIIAADPAKDFIESRASVNTAVYVTITQPAEVDFDIVLADGNRSDNRLICRIRSPQNAFWDVSEIQMETILLNHSLAPLRTTICNDNVGMKAMLAEFDANPLRALVEDAIAGESLDVTLEISGTLENGHFFFARATLKRSDSIVQFSPAIRPYRHFSDFPV